MSLEIAVMRNPYAKVQQITEKWHTNALPFIYYLQKEYVCPICQQIAFDRLRPCGLFG